MSNKNNPLFRKGNIINNSDSYTKQLLKLKEHLVNDVEMVNYVTQSCCDKDIRQYAPKIENILKTYRYLPNTEFLNSNEELNNMMKNGGVLVVNLHKANTMLNYLFYMYDMMSYDLITRSEIRKILCNWVETCPKTNKKLGHFFKKSYAEAVINDFKKTYLRIKNLEKVYDSVYKLKKSKKIDAIKSQKGGSNKLIDRFVSGVIKDKTVQNIATTNIQDVEKLVNNYKDNPMIKLSKQFMNFLQIPQQIIGKMINENSEKTFEHILNFLSTFDKKYQDTSHWDLIFFPLWTIEKWIPESVQVFDMIGNNIEDLSGLSKIFGNVTGGLGTLFADGIDNVLDLGLAGGGVIPIVGSATSAILIAKKLANPAEVFKAFINTFKWSVNNSFNFVNIIFNMSRKRWSRVLRYIADTTGPEGKEQINNLYKNIIKMTDGAQKFSKFSQDMINFFIENPVVKTISQDIAKE